MSEKLKPCPFCGETEILIDYPAARMVRIRCKNCIATFTGKFLRLTREWLEEKMIENWNRRAARERGQERCSVEKIEYLIYQRVQYHYQEENEDFMIGSPKELATAIHKLLEDSK